LASKQISDNPEKNLMGTTSHARLGAYPQSAATKGDPFGQGLAILANIRLG